MFRMLNVHALLARDYRLAEGGAGWRIARVDMMGGQDSDSSAWTIALAKGRQHRLLSWAEFLQAAQPPGDPPQALGELLWSVLDRLEARLRDRTRRRDVARALRAGAPASQTLELLMRGEGALADWLQTHRRLDPSDRSGAVELLGRFSADLEFDRLLLQRDLYAPSDPVPATPLTVRLPDAAPSAPAHRNELRERLDQACAACRNILTLSGSQPSPGRVESVARAVISGSAEAWLEERLRALFPDFNCSARVRTAPVESPPGSPAAQRFQAELPLEIPLWSLRKRTSLPLHVQLNVVGAARMQAKQLEPMLQDTAELLRDWSTRRAAPIVAGGDGWLGLLDQMTWDPELFSHWLGAAPLHERVARLAAVGKPPEDREKHTGWQSLLTSVVDDAALLRIPDWQALAPHLERWDTQQQGELLAALRLSALARMGAKDAATPEIAEWMAAWRRLGSSGSTQKLFAGLCKRAGQDKTLAEVDLAQTFWRDSGRPAEDVPTLARLWAELPACPAEIVAELGGALPADDLRRRASAALAACALAVPPQDARLALPPLEQGAPNPPDWRTDEAWRARIASLFAAWTARLDRSQQHDDWRNLLAHRATLVACGLLAD